MEGRSDTDVTIVRSTRVCVCLWVSLCVCVCLCVWCCGNLCVSCCVVGVFVSFLCVVCGCGSFVSFVRVWFDLGSTFVVWFVILSVCERGSSLCVCCFLVAVWFVDALWAVAFCLVVFFVFRDVRHILFCRSRLVAPQWWSFMCGVVFVCAWGSMVGVSVSVCVRLCLFVPLSLCLFVTIGIAFAF